MDNFKKEILNPENSNNISFLYRYVEDILACFLGSDTELDEFIRFINNVQTNLKFTLGKKINNIINFLDLTIERKNEHLKLYVYRNPKHLPNSLK